MTLQRFRSGFTTVIGFCLALLITSAGHVEPSLAGCSDRELGVDAAVIEHLRIKVPDQERKAWLSAEQGSWEPWLAKQKGFLGRDLYWDPSTQEGVLLIRWSSRKVWKAIPGRDVEAVQERFERLARQATGQDQGNPFPLVYEGELLPP